VKKDLGTENVSYTTMSKRWRYELEVSLGLSKKIEDENRKFEYFNTSAVSGKKRY